MPRLKIGGRSRKGGARGPRGLPGTGFELTDEEDYDMEGRRLCNVGDPKEPDDAVNLKRAKVMFDEYKGHLSEQFVTLGGLEGRLENIVDRERFEARIETFSTVMQTYFNQLLTEFIEKKIDERLQGGK